MPIDLRTSNDYSICTPDSGACAGGYIIEILSVSESSLSLFTLHAPIAVLPLALGWEKIYKYFYLSLQFQLRRMKV